MKGCIIIDFEGEGITEEVALSRVLSVVKLGRIEETTKGTKNFCWHTSFKDGTEVSVRVKKKGQQSDSFTVKGFSR